jgi:hypothetical protein
MSGKGVSIAFVMKLTALIALNLAMLVEAPWIPESPPVLFAVVMLDLVIVQVLILGRPLRAFHYTFFFVGALSCAVVTVLAFLRASGPNVGSLHVIETLIRWSREIQGGRKGFVGQRELGAIARYERWVTCTLSLLPAWGVGWLAARWVRLRGGPTTGWVRGLKAFAQGVVIGFFVLTLGTTLSAIVWGPPRPDSFRSGLHVAALVLCPVLGGLGVWSAGASKRTGSE